MTAAIYQGAGNTYMSSGYDPAAEGCTAKYCATQHTATVDSVHGRRCAQHPPTYSPAHRRRLLADGLTWAADAYLNTWLHIELERAEAQEAAA